MTASPNDAALLRADARRNREQILAAAKEIFAEHGPDVPMEEIARKAAVGVGTLYRRFPDRETLIKAVARDNFSAVLAEARNAVEQEPTAWRALVRYLRLSQELRLNVQLAMVSPVAQGILHDDPDTLRFRRELLQLLDRIVHDAQREGTLRKDIDTGDVTMLISLLVGQARRRWTATTRMGVERSIELMLDGLRAQPGANLPGRPLTADDMDPAVSGG